MAALRRKLRALDYPNPELFDLTNEEQARTLVVLLEDTKIRFYKMEERAALRETDTEGWLEVLDNYLQELECGYSGKDWESNRAAVLDWLLGYAVSLEFQDRAEELSAEPSTAVAQPLSIDVESADCKANVVRIAHLLNLSESDVDYHSLVRAVAKRIVSLFSPSVLAAAKAAAHEKKPHVSLDAMPLGFATGDVTLDTAAKVLRLLYIAELRDLQTKINELVVDVQNITADPKTDTRLGKVGK